MRSKPSLIKLAGHEPLKQRRTINKQTCSILLYAFLPLSPQLHAFVQPHGRCAPCREARISLWPACSGSQAANLEMLWHSRVLTLLEGLIVCLVEQTQISLKVNLRLDFFYYCYNFFVENLKWHVAVNISAIIIIMHKRRAKNALRAWHRSRGHQQGRLMSRGLADGDRVYLLQAGIWNLIIGMTGEEMQPQMSL